MSGSKFEGHDVIAESGNFLLVATPSHTIRSWRALFANVYTRRDNKSWVVEPFPVVLRPPEIVSLAALARLVHCLSPDQRYSIVNIEGLNEDE